mgnify:CR=1
MAETKAPESEPASSLYDSDYCRWVGVMADRLRNRDAGALDWENLTEEIEDLGRMIRLELQRRLRTLLIHLLRWQLQPELRDGSTWRGVICEQRFQIEDLLEESPSLKPKLRAQWPKAYRHAVRQAAHEMGMDEKALPVACPYTPVQVLDLEFLPE